MWKYDFLTQKVYDDFRKTRNLFKSEYYSFFPEIHRLFRPHVTISLTTNSWQSLGDFASSLCLKLRLANRSTCPHSTVSKVANFVVSRKLKINRVPNAQTVNNPGRIDWDILIKRPNPLHLNSARSHKFRIDSRSGMPETNRWFFRGGVRGDKLFIYFYIHMIRLMIHSVYRQFCPLRIQSISTRIRAC